LGLDPIALQLCTLRLSSDYPLCTLHGSVLCKCAATFTKPFSQGESFEVSEMSGLLKVKSLTWPSQASTVQSELPKA
jgi:hypothetical protein